MRDEALQCLLDLSEAGDPPKFIPWSSDANLSKWMCAMKRYNVSSISPSMPPMYATVVKHNGSTLEHNVAKKNTCAEFTIWVLFTRIPSQARLYTVDVLKLTH